MTAEELAGLSASLPSGLPPGLGPGRRVVVSGCAGFIGSHLSEALLHVGCEVTGVDALTDYYDPALKRRNLSALLASSRFRFVEADLLALDPVELMAGASAVFHLAAQAGVRASWGKHFAEYLDRNIRATQHLLEACLDPSVRNSLRRFVYSSSSSVYGERADLPVTEKALPRPHSPYGVTKLAAEQLCVLYAENAGLPTCSLRYFTVYGPRQRPDMAFRRFVDLALEGKPFVMFGDGHQTRDFTYVLDAVRANILALNAPGVAEVCNVGGGARISLNDALSRLGALLAPHLAGGAPVIERHPAARGDVHDTYADRTHVEQAIGYRPTVAFDEGLRRLVSWAVAERNRRG